MDKFLPSLLLSATVFAANMAPVFANATSDIKAGNGVTVNSVAPKSSLIEIEGRTLTDAEAAKVEGEGIFFVAPAVLLVLLKVAAASATKKAAITIGGIVYKAALNSLRDRVIIEVANRTLLSIPTSSARRMGIVF